MNSRYLLLTSALLTGTCFAQSGRNMRDAFQHASPSEHQTPTAQPELRDGGDIVFSDNFANGLAGNNGVGPWTTSGPNGNIWKRTTTGPVGSYSVPTQIMAQPAPANGFMVFLSDSANCNCTSGAANWPASPTEWEGALESPALDLTATPSVMLQWRQRLRWCCQATSPHVVEVSTDGGATWPTSLPAAAGISTNNDPGTQTRQLMLTSAIAANPAMVKFRFKHNPTAAAYHWQIDDVQLIELYTNDMTMNDGIFSHTGSGEEYGRVPVAQLNPTMLVGGSVTNNGAATQTNVTVNMTVSGPVPFTSDITAGDVMPGVIADAQQDYTIPALTPGMYNGTFTVSADAPDEIATNNTFLRNFEVNNNRYSLDGLGNHPTGLETTASLGSSSFTGAADGLVLLNYYQVNSPLMVYGIELALTTTTVAGGYVIASLRDTTPVFATPPAMTTVIVDSEPYDITAANVASGTAQVCFTDPVNLSANGYFGSVTLFSNAGAATIRVIDDLTVPQPGIASSVYIPNDAVYSNGNALAIRLITNPAGTACAVGINEREKLEGVSLFPNPSDGRVFINMTKPGTYTIEVMDLLGAKVFNTRSNGSTTLELASLAKGVYMVRVATENASTVQRITLK